MASLPSYDATARLEHTHALPASTATPGPGGVFDWGNHGPAHRSDLPSTDLNDRSVTSAPQQSPRRRHTALWSAVCSTVAATAHLQLPTPLRPDYTSSSSTAKKDRDQDDYMRLDDDGLSPVLDAHDAQNDLEEDEQAEEQRLVREQREIRRRQRCRLSTALTSDMGGSVHNHAQDSNSLAARANFPPQLHSSTASASSFRAEPVIEGSASWPTGATASSSLPVLSSTPNASFSSSTRPSLATALSKSASIGQCRASKRSGGTARHADQWQSIAHLLEQGDQSAQVEVEEERSEARSLEQKKSISWHHAPLAGRGYPFTSEEPARGSNGQSSPGTSNRTPLLKGAFKRLLSPPKRKGAAIGSISASEATSTDADNDSGMDPEREIEEAAQLVTSEPVSYLDILTPSAIPACEDPLAYVPEAKTLLEADAEEELLQRQDQRRKLAEQESLRGVLYRARAWVQHHLTVGGGIRLTNLQRGLLKCFIAYFLASLCTFSPVLSRRLAMLLPNHDPDKKVPISNLHMIATVSVYFHPAKTLGAMLEADMYALVGFVYSLLLTTLSMLTAVFLHNLDLALLSNFLIVSIFLGGGMGFMAWAKVRMASPSFNTACSMIGIVVFTVMIKEGAAHLGRFSSDKSLQVTICVISGVFISNLICFAIGPQSATKALQADIRRNLTGFATLLKVLTKTFLLDDPRNFSLDSERIKQAIDDHHTSFTSLKKNLREAQMERMLDARMRGQAPARYADVVGSMNRLAQHLGGLRSSCGLQQRIISKQKEATAAAAKQAAMESEAAARRPEAGGEDPFAAGEAEVDADNDGQWKARTDAFGDFVQFIGPHMRSLVFTSSRTLRNLRSAFLTAGDVALPEVRGNEQHNVAREASFASTATQPPQHNHYIPGSSFTLLSEDVRLALERFRHEQSISIKRIYENTMYDECRSVDQLEAVARATKSLADEEIMPDEQVFLVFFFVFNLEEFAKELQYLTAALEQIRQQEERIVRRRAMPMQQWLKSLCTCDSMPSFSLRGRRHSCRQGRRKMKEPQVTFPDYRPHQVNTGQTPAADTLNMRMSRVIWSLGNFLRRPDIKFSIKTGVGAALMAAPAFIHATRPIFKDYQGQWALVSYMIVMSPTVGQSNQMSFQRIAGTVIGAGAAYTAYTLFPDNNVALPIFGALFSVPCFWAIVAKPQHASAGRFVLLTYNLTALYSYNLRKLGIEVEQIAIKRMISVIIGVTWASLLTHLVWPMEARRQLAEGMADLMFKLSYLYQRLVLSYSAEPPDRPATMPQHDWEGDEESRPLLAPDEGSRQRDQFQPLELQLQVAIIRLEGLLVQTKHEPRLKGPFPIAKYKAMINSCQSILDKLHSMRCVTGRDAWHHLVRRDFVIPVNPYRREMVGNVLLYFYILGSAFHLKSPLPPYLPAANAARKALLERIRALPVVRKRQVRGGTEYLLFYSYALAMKEVIEQLEHLGRIAQDNFGVLGGGVESFEQQFRHAPASTAATPRLSTIGISASEQQR